MSDYWIEKGRIDGGEAMSGIEERLLDVMTPLHRGLAIEAAGEIKRLKRDNDLLGKQVASWCHTKALDQAEIERLKAALRAKDCALRQVASSLETLGIDGWSEALYLLQECRAALEGK